MTAVSRSGDPRRTDGSAITYRVTVAGHLDDYWSQWLGGSVLVRNDDTSTALTFATVDQAQLHGVLASIRDLGVSLLSVHSLDGAPEGHPAAERVLDRPLRTRRLELRPATEKDAELTWAYRRLHSVNEWLIGVPATLEEYRSLFLEPSRLASTVIVELVDDRGSPVIGDFMLRLEDAWSQAEVTDQAKGAQAELGWVLDPAYTGLGYATEAIRELLRYCFDRLAVHRVVANCLLDNHTSWQLMERVGMRREAHAVSDSLHRSGQWLDTVGYAVLAREHQHPNAPTGPEEGART
jgi:RimJ/RimL family protein N-acetyltransferase